MLLIRVACRGPGCGSRSSTTASVSPVSAPGESTGVGLGSMRDRAQEVGGRFVVEAMPGGGTRVSVSLPLTPTPLRPDRPLR
jgi:signal transduction histidine kinase